MPPSTALRGGVLFAANLPEPGSSAELFPGHPDFDGVTSATLYASRERQLGWTAGDPGDSRTSSVLVIPLDGHIWAPGDPGRLYGTGVGGLIYLSPDRQVHLEGIHDEVVCAVIMIDGRGAGSTGDSDSFGVDSFENAKVASGDVTSIKYMFKTLPSGLKKVRMHHLGPGGLYRSSQERNTGGILLIRLRGLADVAISGTDPIPTQLALVRGSRVLLPAGTEYSMKGLGSAQGQTSVLEILF